MRPVPLLLAALLATVPLSSQTSASLAAANAAVEAQIPFTLRETRDEIVQRLGHPKVAADFGSDYLSWQYQIDTADHHDFSHYLVFRKANGTLVSVTRNYDKDQRVDALFPAPESFVYRVPNTGPRPYSVLVRLLSDDRVLIAMGISRSDQPVSQLVILCKTEIPFFFPWLFDQLNAAQSRPRTTRTERLQ